MWVCGCLKSSGSPTSLDRVHLSFHRGGPTAYLQTSFWAHLPYLLLDFLTLESGTNWFYSNIGTKLPLCTA